MEIDIETENQIKEIKELCNILEEKINNLNIVNNTNLLYIKISDIDKLAFKKCKRCNKLFIVSYNNTNQCYCSDDCRYGSTKSTRKTRLNEDIKFRAIDNLRKTIYERKYRAKLDNKPLKNIKLLDQILIELKHLQKEKYYLDCETFNICIENLRMAYKKAVKG